nr:RNA-directed DNA polymerase, eukaryota, reverse transcriptase zinc-binding domain protein [Tanacetum cinerariifolium]
STIENDVVEAVRYFFTNAKILKGYNSSIIALIPKVPDANMVKNFRLICLIGSMYKIIAKILTNRLVGVLGDIVSEVQSEFIVEWQILDGPFILNEVLQWCKIKKKKSIIFKVDFEKAYDSVRIMESLHLSFQRVCLRALSTKVGDSMTRVDAWKEVVDKVRTPDIFIESTPPSSP